jgi:hypothetical protein
MHDADRDLVAVIGGQGDAGNGGRIADGVEAQRAGKSLGPSKGYT